jgi:hypothetical protein
MRSICRSHPGQGICVRNIFDLAGNNVVTAHWTLRLTNREGRKGTYTGVTVVNIQGGKVTAVKDYYFDTGPEFRRDWGSSVTGPIFSHQPVPRPSAGTPRA